MAPARSTVEALTEATIDDLAAGFHLRPDAIAVRTLLRPVAARFGHRIAAFDDRVALAGLAAGARSELPVFVRSLTIQGRELVPESGPLLVAANHPGVADALTLQLVLEARPEVKVVALDRPFLRALPAVASRLIWVDPQHPTATLRPARDHLRDGGALLSFPAGGIEPDPVVAPGAVDSLRRWSRSADVLARQVPGLVLLPVAVGGVLSARALRTWFVRRARTRADREWTAATLQVMLHRYHDTDVRVLVGEPFTPGPRPTAELVARVAPLLRSLTRGTPR